MFLKTYLNKSKHLGHNEILELLDFSDKNKIFLKENDFDYWIIGFHSPRNYDISLEAILTFYPFIFTLGFFPFIDHDEIKSTFWIFDKKLNMQKKIEIENEYTIYMTALWVIWKSDDNLIFNKNIPIEVYEPDIKELQKEFVKLIKDKVD